jgi:TetR/AcrR family transcriptional regulator, fatty acid metabolism regulator protein
LRRRAGRPRRAAELRDQAREVYRDAILAAAERVFARSGFSGTRMADVAKAAGLATGTLYNYFANRDELLSSLIGRRTEEMIAAVKAAAAAGGAPRELLVALVRTIFRHFQTHRALFAVLPAAAGISGNHMAAIARQCMASQRSYQAVIAEALEGAAAAGLLRIDVPLALLVGVLTGAAHGVMRTWMNQETEDPPLVDQAGVVVDLFLRGASVDS